MEELKRTTGAASCRGLCKAWTCPGTFQIVSGHNHGGVIVYHYYIGSDPECRQTCSDRRDSRVLIVQNTSNCDIATEVFTKGIENSECKCSLCSEILRHTCEMLRDLIIIKKHEIRGICNNCKMSDTTCNKCAQCNEVMKSFMNNQCRLGQRSQYCRLQSWFRKIRDTLNAQQGRIVPERKRDLLELTKSEMGFREPDISELFSEDAERNRLLKCRDYNQHLSQKYGTKNIPGDVNLMDETHKGKGIGKSKGYPSRTRSLDDRGSKGATKSTTPQLPLKLKSQKQKSIKDSSKRSKSKDKGSHGSPKQSKGKHQAGADDMLSKMMKEAKEVAVRAKDESIKKKKQEDAQLKQRKGAEEPPVKIPVKSPPINATPSQILRFREKADQERNRITGADGKNAAKSLMSSFYEERYRELSFDRLPVIGQVYISPTLESMTSVITSDKNKMPRFKPPQNKIKLPALGVKETKTHTMEYSIMRKHAIDNRKKTENEIKYVTSESGDGLDYNLERRASQQYEMGKMIVGSKICKYEPNSEMVREHKPPKPLFFKVLDIDHSMEFSRKAEVEDINEEEKASMKKRSLLNPLSKGIIRFALSDRQFIDKGWTMLPTEKIVRKMNMYRMRPARPEFGWFKRNKHRCPMSYHSGEELAVIDDDGNGRWFYRNGQVAMDYHVAEEANTQQRYVVYSLGKPDDRHPQRAPATTVLACFDWLGNGVVYDHSGQVRLKYNQTEGVLLDKSLGPATHWKWHTLNDPPVLQKIMVDTELPQKDPELLNYGQGDACFQPELTADNEEMLAIEHENFVKEKSKKLSQKFKPYQIRMKAIKINDQFSLRILDQASVHLLFRDGQNNLKLNLGMVLDPREIVDTETTDVGEVSSSYDRLPAQTASIAHVQQMIMNAKQQDKRRTDLMQRIKRPERQLSMEQLKSAVYKPREVTSGPELYFYS